MASVAECLKVAGLTNEDVRDLLPKLKQASTVGHVKRVVQSELSAVKKERNAAYEAAFGKKFEEPKKPVTFIGMQEVPGKEPVPLVNDESGSTLVFRPEEHEITNVKEFEEAKRSKPASEPQKVEEPLPAGIRGMAENLISKGVIKEAPKLIDGKVVLADGREMSRAEFTKFYTDKVTETPAQVTPEPSSGRLSTKGAPTERPQVPKEKPKQLVEKDGKFYRSDGKPFESEAAVKLYAKRNKGLVPKKVKGGWVLVRGEEELRPKIGPVVAKVYHGTPFSFEEFSPDKRYSGVGIHLGTKEQALSRAREMTAQSKEFGEKGLSPTLMEGTITINNPIYLEEDPLGWSAEDLAYSLRHQDTGLPERLLDKIDALIDNLHSDKINENEANRRLEQILKNAGYDGIVYNNSVEGPGKSYVIFDSSQFKMSGKKSLANLLTTPLEKIEDVNKFRRDIAKRARDVIKSKNPDPKEVAELEDATSRLLMSRQPEDFADAKDWDEFNELNNVLLDTIRKAQERVGRTPTTLLEEEPLPVEDVLDSEPESLDDLLKREGGVITLDSMGLQQAYEKSVEALRKTPEAYEHLRRIARGVVYEGKARFSEFKSRMKEILGDLYVKVKHLLVQAWKDARAWNKKMGEKGFFGSVEGARRLENKRFVELEARANELRDKLWDRLHNGEQLKDLQKSPEAREEKRLRNEIQKILDEWEPASLKEAKKLENREDVEMTPEVLNQMIEEIWGKNVDKFKELWERGRKVSTPEEGRKIDEELEKLRARRDAPDILSPIAALEEPTEANLKRARFTYKHLHPADPIEIFVKTGWFKGPDGKWRFELDDRKAKIHSDKLKEDGVSVPLTEVLNLPKLYEAYPFLEMVKVKTDKTLNSLGGAYPALNLIKIRPNIQATFGGAESTLLHEVQHLIQSREGLASGGAPATIGPKMWNRAVKVVFGKNASKAKELGKIIKFTEREIREYKKNNNVDVGETIFPGTEEKVYRKYGYEKLADMYKKLEKADSDLLSLIRDGLYSPHAGILTHPESQLSEETVYKMLTGETEARDVSTRHELIDLRSQPPAILTHPTLPISSPEQVSESVAPRFVRNKEKGLTEKQLRRREKLKATDLDKQDIVELARAKNFDADFVRARMKYLFGKKSIHDLTHDEADELKLNLSQAPPRKTHKVLEYVNKTKGIRESAKKKLAWAVKAYGVGEEDLAKYLTIASDKGKLDEGAVNRVVEMIKTERELLPITGEPLVMSHLAPVKRLFGEDFMRVWRRRHVQYMENLIPYVHEVNDIFHGLSKEERIAITQYREGRLSAKDLDAKLLKANERLSDVYNRLYNDLEIQRQKLPSYSPRPPHFKGSEIDWFFSPTSAKEIDFWAQHIRRGEWNPHEKDAKKLAMRYLREGFRSKYYNKANEESRPFMDKLDPERRSLAELWINEAMKKVPSRTEKLLNRAAARVLRLAGKRVDPSSRLFKDLVGAMMDLNYSAFMGLRPKLGLRNKMQEWLTFNEYGRDYITGRMIAWTDEISKALEKSDAYKLRKKDYLVVQDYTNKLTDVPKEVREAMMVMYRAADLDNVRVAFASGYAKAKRLGLPMEARIKAGEKAIHATQWGYGIDLPMLFQTTLGRAVGQYTSWPIWYIDHVTRVVKERQGAKAARMAAQFVALYLLQKYGGIDYMRSFGLGVIPTRLGGIVPNQVMAGLRLVRALWSRDISRIKRAAKDEIATAAFGMVPGYLAAVDLKKLYDSKDWKQFLFYTKRKHKGLPALPKLPKLP